MRVLVCECDAVVAHFGRFMLCERCSLQEHRDSFDAHIEYAIIREDRTVIGIYSDYAAAVERSICRGNSSVEMVIGECVLGSRLPDPDKWVPVGPPIRVI